MHYRCHSLHIGLCKLPRLGVGKVFVAGAGHIHGLTQGLAEFELVQKVPTYIDNDENAKAASALKISPSGDYLYCSTAGEETVGIFRIDHETGMLTKICILPISGKYPKDLAVFPDEKTLVVLNHESNEIRFFHIDYEKGLMVLKGKPIHIETPNCILISKVGEFTE